MGGPGKQKVIGEISITCIDKYRNPLYTVLVSKEKYRRRNGYMSRYIRNSLSQQSTGKQEFYGQKLLSAKCTSANIALYIHKVRFKVNMRQWASLNSQNETLHTSTSTFTTLYPFANGQHRLEPYLKNNAML